MVSHLNILVWKWSKIAAQKKVSFFAVKQGESVAVKSTGEEGQWQLSTVLGETLTSKYQVQEDAV